jgi:hypothetical protein
MSVWVEAFFMDILVISAQGSVLRVQCSELVLGVRC